MRYKNEIKFKTCDIIMGFWIGIDLTEGWFLSILAGVCDATWYCVACGVDYQIYTNKGEDYRKITETGERVCLKICLHFTHSPPCSVKIFRIKWSLEANLVGRILRILFIVTFGNFWVSAIPRDSTVRLNRPIGISCEVISPSGYYTSIGIFRLNRPIFQVFPDDRNQI
jgi:hypothetical protein